MSNLLILGINGLGNSPSACLLKNGEIIAMAEEERFNRKKESFGEIPIQAIKYCTQEAAIQIEDIHEIAFAWDCNFYIVGMPIFLAKHLFKSLSKPSTGNKGSFKRAIQELIKYHPIRVRTALRKALKKEFPNHKLPKIKFVNHHESHAASVFFASGLKSATVLVMDGSGEQNATTIWAATKQKLHLKRQFTIPNSLGWFYQALTEFLGFKPNSHEGKTMALAGLGTQNDIVHHHFKQLIQLTPNGYLFNADYAYTGKRTEGEVYSDQLIQLLGKQRIPNEPIDKKHQDIAYYAQKTLEDVAVHLINYTSTLPWFDDNICIAGGVGLNCKLNGVIAKLPNVNKTYVSPFSSDIGTSYGAAIIRHNALSTTLPTSLQHAYWGPQFSDKEIKGALNMFPVTYLQSNEIIPFTAQLLAQNKIIAWFQGRMEVGSRALGNRSILAHPGIEKNRDFINTHIKNREIWRPFAASILYEKRADFFEDPIDSPYMALAFNLKEEAIHQIPAAVHVDNSTRPQFVRKEINPLYWELIHNFGDITGTYALLNTSFNLKEEPIVCSPSDAIKTFLASNLDYLIISDFVVEKAIP